MAETAFTPGPWHCDLSDHGIADNLFVYVEVTDEYGREFIARVRCDRKSWQEDARLIAAAPELFEALKWALPLAELAIGSAGADRIGYGHKIGENGLGALGVYDHERAEITAARTALAKATGAA